MTDDPKPCSYVKTLGYRATKAEHLDDCTDEHTCKGCLPCINGHCSVCSREHTTHQHPNTCPSCVGAVREDLTEIQDLCRQLRGQAMDAEGLSWASARIPGHVAMIAMSPSIDADQLIWANDLKDYHHPRDMVPPLAVLAHWSDIWAGWFGKVRSGRTSVGVEASYLDSQLTQISQLTPKLRGNQLVSPPDFAEFSRDLGGLRANLERILHDEEEGDQGVNCFECGTRLVRRMRDRKTCRHKTPARAALAAHLRRRPDAIAELEALKGGTVADRTRLQREAALPSPVMIAAARMPCDACDQGGVEDPSPGISWECPSCRKKYTPGEYATAVRRDLADQAYIAQGSPTEAPPLQSYGWTDMVLAADAASTLVGYPVYVTTVRTWQARMDVTGCCEWTYQETPDGQLLSNLVGKKLVYWPDVAEAAVAAQERARLAAIARREKAVRDAARAILKGLPRRLSNKRVSQLMGRLPLTSEGELNVVEFQKMAVAATRRNRTTKQTSARAS